METFTVRPVLDISTDYTERIIQHKYVPENSIFQNITICDFLEYAEFKRDLGKGTSAITSLYNLEGKYYVIRFVMNAEKQNLLNEIAIYQTLHESKNTYCFQLLYADICTDRYFPSYFVFTYEEGMTLWNYLDTNNSISAEFAHHFAHHLEKSVRQLHSLGILHRDIKPDNIFIQTDSWIPKLFDFSDAVYAPSPQVEFAGSPKYSHLTIRNSKHSFSLVPFRVEYDMYAIGVILRDDIAPHVRRIADRQDVLSMANYFFDSTQWS